MKKIDFKGEYILIFLFVVAMLFYLNIDKLPLTHPGNLKSADSFYHTLITEGIIDTEQWDYYDLAFSLGMDKIPNSQPPLYYIAAALLTKFSGVPAWSTIYFFVCLSQALFVVLAYLIANELFDNKKIGLIAGAFSVLPLAVHVWLYGTYIGLWLQVPSNMFLLAFLWLFIRFLKKQENLVLFFMGLCITSIMLVHPQDLSVLVVPSLYVVYEIIKKNVKNHKEIIKKGFVFGFVPFILSMVLLPRFLFVWGAQGESQFKVGYYGIRDNYFTRQYAGGLVFPDIFFMHPIVLLLVGITLIYFIIKFKKNLLWIIVNFYYFFIIYGAALFFSNPYYFVRLRTLTPFILAPTIAFGIFKFIIKPLKNINVDGKLATIFICILLIIVGFPDYNIIISEMESEHITKYGWEAYRWIQDNVKSDENVLFMAGSFQAKLIYAKKITAGFDMEEYGKRLSNYYTTGTLPTEFNGEWGGTTVRAVKKREVSKWNYVDFEEPNETLSIFDFNYLFFLGVSPEVINANQELINEYTTRFNFFEIYNKNGYVILKNGNR